MIGAKAKHPNCAYAWMYYITEPEAAGGGRASTSVRRRPTGRPASSPARRSATPTTPTDEAYADKIWYWTTPIAQCLDGRTDATCTDYGDWTQAWTEIKG